MQLVPTFVLLAGLVVLPGCASAPQPATVSTISPLTYQNFTCPQIAAEASRVSARIAELDNAQAAQDVAASAVAGLLLFDPGDDGTVAAERQKQKDTLMALQWTATEKKCVALPGPTKT